MTYIMPVLITVCIAMQLARIVALATLVNTSHYSSRSWRGELMDVICITVWIIAAAF